MCRRYLSPWKGQDIRASVLQGPMTCFPRQHQAWEVDSCLHGQGPCQKRSRSNPAPAMALALDQTPQIHCKSPKVKALCANEKTFALVFLLTPTPSLHMAAFFSLSPRLHMAAFLFPISTLHMADFLHHPQYALLFLTPNLHTTGILCYTYK